MDIDASQSPPSSQYYKDKTQQKYNMSFMGDRVKEFMGKGFSDSEKNRYGLKTTHLHQHIKNVEL